MNLKLSVSHRSIHFQPNITKRAYMIVQLGYELTSVSKHIQVFDWTVFLVSLSTKLNLKLISFKLLDSISCRL